MYVCVAENAELLVFLLFFLQSHILVDWESKTMSGKLGTLQITSKSIENVVLGLIVKKILWKSIFVNFNRFFIDFSTLIFFFKLKKKVRVGGFKLGSVGEPETHLFFFFGLKYIISQNCPLPRCWPTKSNFRSTGMGDYDATFSWQVSGSMTWLDRINRSKSRNNGIALSWWQLSCVCRRSNSIYETRHQHYRHHHVSSSSGQQLRRSSY